MDLSNEMHVIYLIIVYLSKTESFTAKQLIKEKSSHTITFKFP